MEVKLHVFIFTMNKINKLTVKGHKEWACGKQMLGGFLCGEQFGKYKFAICDDCLCKFIRREAVIKLIKKNKELTMEEKHKKIRHIELGLVKV